MEEPHSESLSATEQARVSAAIQLSGERVKAAIAEADLNPIIRAASPEEELDERKRMRDGIGADRQPELIDGEPNPEFIDFRDCDRILAAGTIALIGNVEFRILRDTPCMAPEFRDEAIFAESLAHGGKGLAVNAAGLRNRYNGNGAKVGVNEDHPLNKLDARIAELELEVAARAKAAAEIEKAKKEEEAKPLPIADVRASAPQPEAPQSDQG
jgi:hypothetical protein